jgi:hypothetical protein
MKIRTEVAVPILAAGILLAACGGGSGPADATPGERGTPTIVPLSVAPSATPSAAPAWYGTNCTPNDIVVALRPTLPYAEFNLSHNYLMSTYYLNIWLVDTSLDPLALGEQIESGARLAARHATMVSHQLNQGDPCVAEIFDQITATIVDPGYNTWFSGNIAPADLPPSPRPSDAEVDQAIQAFTVGYRRTQATASQAAGPIPPESCAWTEVSARIEAAFDATHPNLAFYLVIDDSGVNVWTQWDGPPEVEVFFPRLAQVGLELACLYPPVDDLWVVYVDRNGGAQLVVAVPGEPIRQADAGAILEQMEVIYPSGG